MRTFHICIKYRSKFRWEGKRKTWEQPFCLGFGRTTPSPSNAKHGRRKSLTFQVLPPSVFTLRFGCITHTKERFGGANLCTRWPEIPLQEHRSGQGIHAGVISTRVNLCMHWLSIARLLVCSANEFTWCLVWRACLSPLPLCFLHANEQINLDLNEQSTWMTSRSSWWRRRRPRSGGARTCAWPRARV
jgi:hypothetical protein